jgi:hypothetical protein
MVKDRVMKSSGMIDLSIWVANRGLNILSITSGPDWKWKKNSKFSKLIFQIKTYITLLGLFSSVIQMTQPEVKVPTSGYFKSEDPG